MAQAVFRSARLALAALAMVTAIPVVAQQYSDGYKFLKGVRDRDGTAVTDVLNEPGSIIVNTRDRATGETGLHIVTRRRDTTWIKFLVQRGANPNIADKKGVTPILLASNLGFVEGIEALLKAGARVDDANSAGETPLMSAVHRRNTAMIRLLMKNGADPDRNDNSGRSARDYAMLMGGSGFVLAELERAEEDRAGDGTDKTYGPSF